MADVTFNSALRQIRTNTIVSFTLLLLGFTAITLNNVVVENYSRRVVDQQFNPVSDGDFMGINIVCGLIYAFTATLGLLMTFTDSTPLRALTLFFAIACVVSGLVGTIMNAVQIIGVIHLISTMNGRCSFFNSSMSNHFECESRNLQYWLVFEVALMIINLSSFCVGCFDVKITYLQIKKDPNPFQPRTTLPDLESQQVRAELDSNSRGSRYVVVISNPNSQVRVEDAPPPYSTTDRRASIREQCL